MRQARVEDAETDCNPLFRTATLCSSTIDDIRFSVLLHTWERWQVRHRCGGAVLVGWEKPRNADGSALIWALIRRQREVSMAQWAPLSIARC